MAANKGSFKKGHTPSPNVGRPKGKGRMTKFLEYTEDKMQAVADKLTALALDGDLGAIKLLLDRHYPVATGQMLVIEQEMQELRKLLEASNEAERS